MATNKIQIANVGESRLLALQRLLAIAHANQRVSAGTKSSATHTWGIPTQRRFCTTAPVDSQFSPRLKANIQGIELRAKGRACGAIHGLGDHAISDRLSDARNPILGADLARVDARPRQNRDKGGTV